MFDIVTSLDFYAALVQDFDDFMDNQSSSRHALYCAITAYLLHEWVWGDWLGNDHDTWKTLGIRDKESFLAWVDRACPWFAFIQSLANGAKHSLDAATSRQAEWLDTGKGPMESALMDRATC